MKSADIFERLPNNAELVGSLLHRSALHQQMRQYRTAREEATRAMKLATETKLDGQCNDASNLLMSLESDIHRYPRNGSPKVQRVRNLITDNLHRKLSLKTS